MKLNFTKEGLLPADEFNHLVWSIRVLGNCVFFPSMGGKYVDGVDCKAVDILWGDDVNEVKDALETVAEVYGLNIKFEP